MYIVAAILSPPPLLRLRPLHSLSADRGASRAASADPFDPNFDLGVHARGPLFDHGNLKWLIGEKGRHLVSLGGSALSRISSCRLNIYFISFN
jgi:hypothetical protein